MTVNRRPDGNLSSLMFGCRLRGHRVLKQRVGRFTTLYCADDLSFYYLWRWQHRIYAMSSRYSGGVKPAGLRRLMVTLTRVR